MKRLLAALVLVAACGTSTTPAADVTSPTPSSVASPQTTPTASPVLGVFADRASGKVALVDSNGGVVATLGVVPPHRYNETLPWTSTSVSGVYYLTAAGDVSFLRPGGTVGLVTNIGLASREEAGFAVSPDDTKIAVAVLKYGPGPSPSASNFVVTPILGDVEGWLDANRIVYRLRSNGTLHFLQLPTLDGAPMIPMSGPATTFEGTVPTTIS